MFASIEHPFYTATMQNPLPPFFSFEKSPTLRALKALDVRDILVFGGLAMLGYGLFLFKPWLGFAVPGFLMLILGLLWPVFLSFAARRK